MICNIKKLMSNLMDIYKEIDNKTIKECNVFPQTWGSTALGFGGIGGSALTTAFTTIIKDKDDLYYVFFDGTLAYIVEKPTEEFYHDISARKMVSCDEAKTRY